MIEERTDFRKNSHFYLFNKRVLEANKETYN